MDTVQGDLLGGGLLGSTNEDLLIKMEKVIQKQMQIEWEADTKI